MQLGLLIFYLAIISAVYSIVVSKIMPTIKKMRILYIFLIND